MNTKKKKIDDDYKNSSLNKENKLKSNLENKSVTHERNAEKINLLNNEVEKLYKKYLIQKSKFQNKINIVYNCTRKDINNTLKYCLEKFIIDLLPTIDNLERSLALIKESDVMYKMTGNEFELVCKNFLDLLLKFGVEIIDQTNILFNPKIHQAMSIYYSNDIKPNHVVTVLQKGYQLNKRLLRPSMVIVSQLKNV